MQLQLVKEEASDSESGGGVYGKAWGEKSEKRDVIIIISKRKRYFNLPYVFVSVLLKGYTILSIIASISLA